MEIPSLEAPRAACAAGQKFAFHPFYGHTTVEGRVTDACLSQWFPCTFEVEGATYASTEQWMMAGKARLFGDDETLARIHGTSSPADAKKLGRAVRGFDEAQWAARRFDLVTAGNLAKFGQNPALAGLLEATGNAVLVEAAPRDRVWGVGLGRNNPQIGQPEAWRGLNLLGFALMRVRAHLRAQRVGSAMWGL